MRHNHYNPSREDVKLKEVNKLIRHAIYGGVVGDGIIANCYSVGASFSELYLKQHEQDIQIQKRNLEDAISLNPI